MKRFISRFILALMGTLLVPGVAFAQVGEGLNKGREETKVTYVLPSVLSQGTTHASDVVLGMDGVVGRKLLTGISNTTDFPTSFTLTRTGTNAVAPPPYPAKIVFGIFDNGSNSVVTCSTTEVWGVGPDGRNRYEKITTNTLDDTMGSSPQITRYAYADLMKIKFSGCVCDNGTLTGDSIIAEVSDQVWVGQNIPNWRHIGKVCARTLNDDDGDGATNDGNGEGVNVSWQCRSGYKINAEQSGAFDAIASTLDLGTVLADTDLFASSTDLTTGIVFETFTKSLPALSF